MRKAKFPTNLEQPPDTTVYILLGKVLNYTNSIHLTFKKFKALGIFGKINMKLPIERTQTTQKYKPGCQSSNEFTETT